MVNYEEYKKKKMQDPEFKAAYDALQPTYDEILAKIDNSIDAKRMMSRLITKMIQLRKEQKLTRKDLARLSGVKRNTIVKIEKREKIQTLQLFCKLVSALGLDVTIVKKQLQKTLDECMKKPYRLVIVPDCEEGGYTAYYPELRGCATCAETLPDLLNMAEDAKKEWLMRS